MSKNVYICNRLNLSFYLFKEIYNIHVKYTCELKNYFLFFRPLGTFWKLARIGERKSPYVSFCCIAMAFSILFWT